MEHRVNLRCTRDEAIALRTALHIATRLCALLPHGYGNRNWSEQFDKLHADMAKGAVDILPGAPAFSDNIIAVIREHGEHPDDKLLRELLGGLLGGPFDLIASRPSGGKSQLKQDMLRAMLDDVGMVDALGPFLFTAPVTGRTTIAEVGQSQNLRKLPDVLMDDQSARHVGLTASQTGLVNKPAPRKWVVQFLMTGAQGWRRVEGGSDTATAAYESRNEAYRQMRARAKNLGYPLERYRVVPEGTAEGKEKDRGFYTAEFFTKHALHKHQLGWNTSTVVGLTGTFPTAEGAQAAIDAHVGNNPARLRRYRVKWHQSKA
ncbi:hypothetical protein [Bacteriophage Titan-X]|uniref:Uncharacterized protein n=1 Tax=Bacteriophage Titan-X TaxID=2662140 RepID=A0A5Q2U8D3_9CAUD|nr:hypothetical protein [Bacteriophage Titan-X]